MTDEKNKKLNKVWAYIVAIFLIILAVVVGKDLIITIISSYK